MVQSIARPPSMARATHPTARRKKIYPTTRPTTEQVEERGLTTAIWPIPRWEITQPGNSCALRAWRGSRSRSGRPRCEEDPGRLPDVKLSIRGFGTDLAPTRFSISLQKTRLLDPTLALLGTNDHPGDFRASDAPPAMSSTANDRSPVHSSYWAKYGNRGESFSIDKAVNPSPNPTTQPTMEPYGNRSIARHEFPARRHPIQHVFVRKYADEHVASSAMSIPAPMCLNSYLGSCGGTTKPTASSCTPQKQVNPGRRAGL